MSPTRLERENYVFYPQTCYFFLCESVVNFYQITFSLKNIVKHVAYIHYTENRVDNVASLLWMEKSQNQYNGI
jgi:hypothetical protein